MFCTEKILTETNWRHQLIHYVTHHVARCRCQFLFSSYVLKELIKFPLKGKGCQVVVNVLIVFVRHLGTFVNASHNWHRVSSLPKIDDTSHCSSDFHNSSLFSEHLGTVR